MKDPLIKTSKFLSFVLRHQPQSIGLQLDEQGWVSLETLVDAARKHGKSLNQEQIRDIVARNDKQRFALSKDGSQIRANQGHSIAIDLGLKASEPPETLFHGTAKRFLPSILQTGLKPSGRHHVHLSADYDTAWKVGARHGSPVVLHIEAKLMHADGALFYRSDNGVWLTDNVHIKHLSMKLEVVGEHG